MVLLYLAKNVILPCLRWNKYLHASFSFMIESRRLPTFRHSERFNDILFQRKLTLWDQAHVLARYTDKYGVKDWVEKTIGKKYLVPNQGVYDTIEGINWAKLKYPLVIKPTHSSGKVILAHSKEDVTPEVLATMRGWLKVNHYLTTAEPHYKALKPRILIEDMLNPEKNGSIADIKFHCFYGKCAFVQPIWNISDKDNHEQGFFTPWTWDQLSFNMGKPGLKKPYPRPKQMDEMLKLVEKLSSQFKYVRVDMYLVHGKIYFGELTFFHRNCHAKFSPAESESWVGRHYLTPPVKANMKKWI